MKKGLFFWVIVISSISLKAQSDSIAIVKTIQVFFNGMESYDTVKINTTIDSSIFLYSIMKNKNEESILTNETKQEFYRQIISLKGKNYQEKIVSYEIKQDANMAIVWAPYEFIFEGNFSHCGVNVFTMIKSRETWKILGITDTRRKKGCR